MRHLNNASFFYALVCFSAKNCPRSHLFEALDALRNGMQIDKNVIDEILARELEKGKTEEELLNMINATLADFAEKRDALIEALIEAVKSINNNITVEPLQ